MAELQLIIIPDAEEPDAAEVYVDGFVDGRPYRFLLDTGAARSALVFDDYTATFDSAATNHSSGVFARRSEDVISVPSLEVGPIAKHDFQMVRAEAQNPQLRNLIGMDVLKDFCCHFRFDVNRVVANPPEGADSESAVHDLYLDSRYHPYVEVDLGGVRANAVWDTGASITVADVGFIHAHLATFEQIGTSTGTDSTGAQMETPMFLMAESVIGGHHFARQKVAAVDLSHVNATIERPMDLILGYNVLSTAHWWFDFPRRQWAITSHP